MRLQARDKRALIGGAIILVALLAYLLWPRGGAESGVELVAAEDRGAPAVAPQPLQPVQPAMPAQPVQPAAGPVPEGLKLTGVTATGAIFAFADGSQRLVRRGREVAPGLTLRTVRLRDVILVSPNGTFRLTFSSVASPVQVPQPAAAPPNATPPAQPLDRGLFR